MLLKKFRSTTQVCLALILSMFSGGLLPTSVALAYPGTGTGTLHEVVCHAEGNGSWHPIPPAQTSNHIDENGQPLPNGVHIDDFLIYAQYPADTAWNDLSKEIKDQFEAECAKGPEVTAAPVTFDDQCGTANDTFTVPSTDYVEYSQGDTVIPAGTYPGTGTVTVTAEAILLHELVGDDEWEYTFTNEACPISVTPETPNVSPICGPNNDTVTIPTQTGVNYNSTGWVNGSLTITATAQTGYILIGTTSWTFADANVTCPPQGEPDLEFDFDDACIEGEDDGSVSVDINNEDGTAAANSLDVVLYDDEGSVIDVQTVDVAAGEEETVTFDNLPEGIYSIEVFDDETSLGASEELEVDECGGGLIDVCPNLDDIQLIIPEGLVRDDEGNCISDQCPLVPGVQTSTILCPAGHVDVDGVSTTRTTPQVLSATLPASLPATGSETSPLALILAMLAAYGAVYFLQGRRQLGISLEK